MAADEKKEPAKGNEPIKVIEIKRKDPVLYDKDVEPILVNKCMFCHSGNLKEGKLDTATYEGLMKGGKSGDVVKPGKSQDSPLYKRVQRTITPIKHAMPPKGEEPCTAEEVAIIKLWIDSGAKAPSGVRPRPKVFVSVLGVDPITAIRAASYWPSVAMKVDSKVGTVSAGKYADIVAVAGNPAEDVSELERVKFVMKGGQVVRNDFIAAGANVTRR